MSDEATYKRRVAELTAENRELRRSLAAQKRASQAVERRLRAERDECAAPQLVALQLALRAATEERDRATACVQRLRRQSV